MILLNIDNWDYIVSDRLYNEHIVLELLLGKGDIDVFVHLRVEKYGEDSYPIHYTITGATWNRVIMMIRKEYNDNFQYIDNVIKNHKNLYHKLLKREERFGAYCYYFKRLTLLQKKRLRIIKNEIQKERDIVLYLVERIKNV